MSVFLLIVVYAMGVALIVQEVIDVLYVLQLKEYRFDRIRDFVTSRGGELFLRKRILALVFFLVFIAIDVSIVFLASSRGVAAEFLLIPLYLYALYVTIQFYGFVRRAIAKKVKYPGMTMRMAAATFSAFFVLLIAVFAFSDLIFTYIETSIILFIAVAPFFAILGVVATVPLSIVLKNRIFNQARSIREAQKNLVVIGITGSYGKTSVKEFLYAVLQSHFRVLKTKEHVNTQIGVAQTVIQDLTSEYDVFIVEMGAYAKGEIKAICEIVKPKIGVITAVNEQHVSLFGSIGTIVNTKAELVFSLPKNGFAVLNKDNKYTRKIAEKLKVKKYLYSMEDESDISLHDVSIKGKKTHFTVLFSGKKFPFQTQLIGIHNVQNLLPVILIGLKLGVPPRKIQNEIAKLKNQRDNMEVMEDGDDIIVNNTYNLNPASIDAFLDIAKRTKTDARVLVLDDVLELGDEARVIHQKIARKIEGEVDVLVYVGINYAPIVRKILVGSETRVVVAASPEKVAATIDTLQGSKTIGFLGRGAKKHFTTLYE